MIYRFRFSDGGFLNCCVFMQQEVLNKRLTVWRIQSAYWLLLQMVGCVHFPKYRAALAVTVSSVFEMMHSGANQRFRLALENRLNFFAY